MKIWQNLEKVSAELLPDTAHIYLVNLDQIKVDLNILTTDEQARAHKMHFATHQQRTAKARAILRLLLSQYTHILPGDLQFSTYEYGKLYLADHTVQFNLAHSHDYAVFAFTRDIEIGVDIEQPRTIEFDAIAKRIMSDTEYVYWSSLTPRNDEQIKLFFQIWTRKEALVKATGDGLSGPLKSLSTIDSDGNICSAVNYSDKKQLWLSDLPSLTKIINRPFYAALAATSFLTTNCYHLTL
ncbi:MAG: 4'-phosphopantetheinyl transferase superfamily protein [Gammaproteobacteria bacterium]|nr:4'-phosphopantetheinyl transferase superfamily protein [Gammaproteobacteria bacterium]